MTGKYTLGIYEKALPPTYTWEEKLLAAKEYGYDFLEISIDETDAKLARLDMPAAKRLELVQLMKQTGIPIRTMCLSGHRKYPLGSEDPAVEKRGLEIMEKALHLADDLGIRIIQLAGYDVYYEPSTIKTIRRFEQNLLIASEMAASLGILLGFETMETEFMNTVVKAMHYAAEIESPYLGVYPDIGNLTNAAVLYENSVEDDLETGRGHLYAVHLKETVPGKFREIPFGTGHVNFEAAIQKAWDLGVRKYVTEFWHVEGADWKAETKTAVHMMRAILDKQQ